MKVCKRILAGLTFLLALAGLLLSLAGGVGVWLVKEPVTEKTTRIFGRIEAALDVADQGLDHVETSLARAGERLDSAREQQRKLAQEPQTGGALRRMLARTVRQSIAPELGDANEKLHTVAEAAVVVNSVLEDVGSFPFLETTGLDLGRLTEMNSRLAGVAPAAWDLSRLLGESGPDADAGAQISRIAQVLQTMRRSIADYKSQVTQVRQRVGALQAKTLPWITPAAALVSGVCFWIALSQVSLLFHACSWWRHAGRTNPRPV
jgi:hypothetical protein